MLCYLHFFLYYFSLELCNTLWWYATGATTTAFHDKRKQAETEIRRAQEQIASGRMQEENLRKQVTEA